MKIILNIFLAPVLFSYGLNINFFNNMTAPNTNFIQSSFKETETKIDIYRQNTIGCLSGYILLNRQIIGYSVERPDVDNINDISAIPAGSYNAHIRNDGKLKWRLELEGVSDRENIQIHIGNYINVIDEKTGLERCSLKGCIIIGESLGEDLCSVSNSKKALNKMKEEIEKNNVTNLDKIIVTIH